MPSRGLTQAVSTQSWNIIPFLPLWQQAARPPLPAIVWPTEISDFDLSPRSSGSSHLLPLLCILCAMSFQLESPILFKIKPFLKKSYIFLTHIFNSCVALCLVVSNSLRPHGLACQASLSMLILQARILEWVALEWSSSRGSSQPSNCTQVSCTAGGFFTVWTTIESLLTVQFSCVWFFATPWTAARQDSLSTTNSWTLLKLKSIASVMPSNHLPASGSFPMSRFFASCGLLAVISF